MKWFKHETDAHMNLKLQSVINKFGAEAYGYYWACAEIVANQGENYRLISKKEWKLHLKKFLNVTESVQDQYLNYFAEKNLIDKKALQKGDLYIPKLEERQDEYTEKLRRRSRQHPDIVPLEENRREENTKEEKRENAFDIFWSAFPNKEAKKKTLEIWKRKKLDDQLPLILSFIEKAKNTDRWKKGFIKQPPTFLNNESWNDDLAAYGSSNSAPNVLNQGEVHRSKTLEKITERNIAA